MRRKAWAAAVIPALLAGCNTPDEAAPAPGKDVTAAETSTSTGFEATEPSAVANLEKASGVAAGKAAAVPMKESVLLTLQVEGLPPGRHGVHVHMVGKCDPPGFESAGSHRSEEHTSELQSLMRISYAVFCLKKKSITTR